MNLSDPASSVTERLSLVPDGADAALVMRHAKREEIPAGTFGFDVSLTADGAASAERLGEALSERPLDRIAASPVPRCVHTAEAILRGGDWSGEVARDCRLGEPGPFIVEPEVSGDLFLSVGIWEIVRRQLSDTVPPPGMRATVEGVELLKGLVTSNLEQHGRLPEAEEHRSDGYRVYEWLPRNRHVVGMGGETNWNEGVHSVLRGRLNRLGRRTKGYSKSEAMLRDSVALVWLQLEWM